MSNADSPKILKNTQNALDYAIFQIVSHMDTDYFNKNLDCEKQNGTFTYQTISFENITLDATERNFFFTVFNTKNALIKILENLNSDIYLQTLKLHSNNYIVFLYIFILQRGNNGLELH